MLDPNPVGANIAAFVKAQRPTPGTPVTDAQLTALWQGIMAQIYNDLKANLGIAVGTFQVEASTIIAPSGGGPCSGSGVIVGVGGPAE